jgi:hypothetical protein
MGPSPIPEVLPLIELLLDVRRFRINRRPEFLEIGALRPLNFPVEMG